VKILVIEATDISRKRRLYATSKVPVFVIDFTDNKILLIHHQQQQQQQQQQYTTTT